MSHPLTRRWSNERRAAPPKPQHRGRITVGVALVAIVIWSVVTWGVAEVVAAITSVPLLLLSLADAVVMAR